MLHNELRTSVTRILAELNRLERLGVDKRHLDKLIREAVFYLYEGGESAKWSFERPHSAAARALHRNCRERGLVFRGSRDGLWQVTYNHAAPLALLRAQILAASENAERLLDLLDRCVCGVIITMAENDRLCRAGYRSSIPNGAALYDLTARYRAVGIEFESEDLQRLTDRRRA
jgi:hypothetical protein